MSQRPGAGAELDTSTGSGKRTFARVPSAEREGVLTPADGLSGVRDEPRVAIVRPENPALASSSSQLESLATGAEAPPPFTPLETPARVLDR